jgi:uncharacterized lipoprotein YmbA
MKKFLLIMFALAVAGCSTPVKPPANSVTSTLKAPGAQKQGSILWADQNRVPKK